MMFWLWKREKDWKVNQLTKFFSFDPFISSLLSIAADSVRVRLKCEKKEKVSRFALPFSLLLNRTGLDAQHHRQVPTGKQQQTKAE